MTPYLLTAAGPRLACYPLSYVIPTDPAKAQVFADLHNRRADLLLSEGRFAQAERAAHLAYEASCWALGEQA